MLLHQGMDFGQRLEAVFRMTHAGRDVSQQGVKGMEHSLHCPNSSPGSDPLAYLCHTRFGLALNGLLVPPHQRVPRGLDMDPQDAFHQPPEQQRQP